MWPIISKELGQLVNGRERKIDGDFGLAFRF